ncbi:hypothetical protein MTO96_009419 [Rhipicephalus appendiculatus]
MPKSVDLNGGRERRFTDAFVAAQSLRPSKQGSAAACNGRLPAQSLLSGPWPAHHLLVRFRPASSSQHPAPAVLASPMPMESGRAPLLRGCVTQQQ